VHLNPGFHDLHYTDGTPQPGSDIWQRDTVLGIRHYKLAKLLFKHTRAAAAETISDSTRTAQNLARIFGPGSEGVEALTRLPRTHYSPDEFHQLVAQLRGKPLAREAGLHG
jgi:hypothetical protein